jgi:Mrp family chromosome partitioning ATPase
MIQQAIERAKQEYAVRGGSKANTATSASHADPQRRHSDRRTSLAAPHHAYLSLPTAVVEAESRLLLRSHLHEDSAAAYDAYRILRTKLRRVSNATGWTRFGITSAGQGDGKSTTAANLALAFARDNHENVFLIDLDLRRPSLCGYFGIAAAPREIGEFLETGGDPHALLFSPGISRLTMAGGTHRYEHSSEMLAGGHLETLLAHIASVDPQAWVFVDLPPVLSTADVLTVAPLLSAMILVASEGYTRRDDLTRAVEALAGTEIAGVVLNKTRRSQSGAYGYY